MPKLNPMGYIKGAKNISATNATKTISGKSSAATASIRNSRMAKSIMKHPGRSAAIGAAGVAGLGLARSRKSGLNKGRSSMYNY